MKKLLYLCTSTLVFLTVILLSACVNNDSTSASFEASQDAQVSAQSFKESAEYSLLIATMKDSYAGYDYTIDLDVESAELQMTLHHDFQAGSLDVSNSAIMNAWYDFVSTCKEVTVDSRNYIEAAGYLDIDVRYCAYDSGNTLLLEVLNGKVVFDYTK